LLALVALICSESQSRILAGGAEHTEHEVAAAALGTIVTEYKLTVLAPMAVLCGVLLAPSMPIISVSLDPYVFTITEHS